MIHRRRRNSLVFPTPLQTLSLLNIKDRRHGFAFLNGDASAIPVLSQPPSFDSGLTPITSTYSLCIPHFRTLSPPLHPPCIFLADRVGVLSDSDTEPAQASWAYLQPMSSSSFASSSHSQLFFSRLWDCVSSWHPLEVLTEYVKGCFLPAVQKIHDLIRHIVRWLMAR